jgi:hypothetical protein
VLLTQAIITLCKSLASRQALAFGELLKTACPDRMVRVDKSWTNDQPGSEFSGSHTHKSTSSENLVSLSVVPGFMSHNGVTESRWLHEVERLCHETLDQNRSTIVCVPDFRDIGRLKRVLEELGLGAFVNSYETGATKSELFARHLRALDSKPQIVIGSRNSLYAPLQNLGSIVLWDEGDEGHQDESSPYLHINNIEVSDTCHNGEILFGTKKDPNGINISKFSDIKAIIGKLYINDIDNTDNLNSSWALSHLLVWNTNLSSEKLRIVFDSFINYLSYPAKNDVILYKNIYPRTLLPCTEKFTINSLPTINISTPLWAGYYAGNYNSQTNELPDFNGNAFRNIKSNMIKNDQELL